MERVDAIVLSGGSAFGLAAADGAMQWLAAHGRGFAVGSVRVPIVPAASLFDLINGGDEAGRLSRSAYRALGRCRLRGGGGRHRRSARVGAGTGATTADLKGGFGAAETVLADGSRVAAFVAVNAVGRVTLGTTPHFRAAPFEQDGGVRRPRPPRGAPARCWRGRDQAADDTAREHHARRHRHRLRAVALGGEAPRDRRP